MAYVRKSFHEIPVDAAYEEPVDFRVRRVPPPWLRASQMAIRIGGVLLVLAVLLFSAVVAEKIELTPTQDPSSPRSP
jgi:hypothetical protein